MLSLAQFGAVAPRNTGALLNFLIALLAQLFGWKKASPPPAPVPAPRPAAKTTGKWVGAGVAICCSFLMAREGFEPVAKHEAADPAGVITWCFGRTNYDDPSVKAGTHFTKPECEQFLADDLPKYAAPVEKCVPSFNDMPPHRQAALVSFAYNLGSGTLCKSSVARNLNAGNLKAGCEAMLAFDHANGKVLRGLQLRRQAERDMCLRED